MKISPLVLFGSIIAIVILCLVIRHRGSSLDKELEQKWANEKTLLIEQAKNNLEAAQRWQNVAIVRGQRVAKLDTMLAMASNTKDSIVLYQEQVVQLKTQVGEWQNAFRLLEQARMNEFDRANLAEQRLSLYQGALARALQKADCRLLGIGFLPKCPSRTVSLVLGAAIGTTVVLTYR